MTQQDQWIWAWELSIPSRTDEGARVMETLLNELEKHEWIAEHLFGVNLAVEEALVNAIKHGNLEDPDKQVHLSFRLSQECFAVDIADEGEGFDPGDVPDPTEDDNLERPGGRGIMLMRTFMNHVKYNERGNRVQMEKWRTGAEAQ